MNFTTIILISVVGILGPAHCFPYGQLANVIKGGLGVSDFISHVRNTVGQAPDFTTKNGFDYSNVYNSILQYSVLNAYLERENHKLLTQQGEHQVQVHNSIEKFNITQTICLIALLLFTLILVSIGVIQVRRMPTPKRRNRNDIEDY